MTMPKIKSKDVGSRAPKPLKKTSKPKTRSCLQQSQNTELALEVLPQALEEVRHGLRILAEVAEDNDGALRGLVDVAAEAAVALQRLWLQGHADELTSQALYGDALSARERSQLDSTRRRLISLAEARLVWPAILTPRPIDAERAQQWLTTELQLGKKAVIKPPRREASEHQEGFRLLAVEVIREAEALCQDSLAQEGEGELGERLELGRRLVSLSSEPSKKWLGTLEKNWNLLLGEDWLTERPQLRSFRHAYREEGGIGVPTHQKKAAPGALKRKPRENSHARMLQRHANHELRRAVAGLLPTA
jgi:hypothetical protein